MRLYRPNISVRKLKDMLTMRVLLVGIGGRHFVILRVGVMAPSNLMLPPKQKAITLCPVINVCYSYTTVYNRFHIPLQKTHHSSNESDFFDV
jgi:hypothetical protein